MMRAAILLCLALAACGDKRTLVRDEPSRASIPVATGCVSGERPTPPTALQAQIPADRWRSLSVKQKAESVSAQALDRTNFGIDLNAATGACK